ncbi:MAG: VTT domain-containing protein [bacterium]
MLDFVMHIDANFQMLLLKYGTRIYAILFLIIFVETGVVIMPFLPGDTLLFVAGSAAGAGHMSIRLILILAFIAAVVGDAVNYHIGKYFGHIVLAWKVRGRQLVQEKYIHKTENFFAKYGKKTIILARFVPIVRTFAPFVAGIGDMPYRVFLAYNMIGGALRVLGLTLAGYFFGQIAWVQANFEKVIRAILIISLLPIIIEYIKHVVKRK